MTADDCGSRTDLSWVERILDADPTDWDLRMAYADLLDDVGEHARANGQRWQGANRRTPMKATNAQAGMSGNVRNWDWRDDQVNNGTDEIIMCQVGRRIMVALEVLPGDLKYQDCYVEYPTRQDAERALAAALEKLGIAAELPVVSGATT